MGKDGIMLAWDVEVRAAGDAHELIRDGWLMCGMLLQDNIGVGE